jgi:hypothetical protein
VQTHEIATNIGYFFNSLLGRSQQCCKASEERGQRQEPRPDHIGTGISDLGRIKQRK